ncbi:MAG: CHASE4 domain-containing protein [Candidatus Zixiibacteriota bacterium]
MISLRSKTYFFIAVTALIFFVGVFFVLHLLRTEERLDYQRRDGEEKLMVAERVLQNESQSLSVKLSDWARWDDTYQFIQNKNEEFITSNLNDESFQTIGVHMMVFINNSGELVYGKQVYSGAPTETTIPDEYLHYFLKGSTLLDFTDLTAAKGGILTTKDSMLLLSAQRITSSDGKAPRLGTLIFANYIDARFNSILGEISGVNVDVYPYGYEDTEKQMTTPNLRMDVPTVVKIENERVTGYHLIENIFENPALILKIEYPATILAMGSKYMWKNIWYVFFGLMTFVSVLIVVIDIFLIRPIETMRQIVRQVSTLQAGEPPSSDLDDFGHLASVMMNMIKENQQCQISVSGSKSELAKFKMAFDQSFDHIVMTDVDGNILYANTAAQQLTGFSKKEMEGNTPALWGRQMSAGFYKEFWETIRLHKKIFEGELINKNKEGVRYKAYVRVTPILDDKKRVLYFIGIERALGKA